MTFSPSMEEQPQNFENSSQHEFVKQSLQELDNPILIIFQTDNQKISSKYWIRLRSWLSPTVTQLEQDEIQYEAEANGAFSLDYIVLIVISCILATLGLLSNSSAVIIGAMLVAPLMSPLIAFAVGMATGRVTLITKSFSTLFRGILAALIVARIIGSISPTTIVTSEMLLRGNLTLIDIGVAFASGFIGAFASVRKNISAALAGVAIAAALMPPLATIALGWAFDNRPLAAGASSFVYCQHCFNHFSRMGCVLLVGIASRFLV